MFGSTSIQIRHARQLTRHKLDLLNGLLAVAQERLDEIKTQLYERWEEYDHFFTDEIEFEYNSPDAAFEASQIRAVVVNSLGTAEYPSRPILQYKVTWDPEHESKHSLQSR